MTMLLDAGALIALDRNEQAIWRELKHALRSSDPPVTHGGVVGQVWRGLGARQARLANALSGIRVRALDDALGRAAGDLLRRANADDVIDAALVLLANDGDTIYTSDPDDLELLAAAAGLDVEIVAV